MATVAHYKATPLERRIAKQLGITDHMLAVLFRLKRGDKISGNNAGTSLEAKGLVTGQGWRAGVWHGRTLTAAGLAACQRARDLGY